MKRSILYFLLGIIFLFGCSEGLKGVDSDYTIKVTGSGQLQFSGHYTIAGTGALPMPIQVKGAVPAEYKGKGVAAACVFRKTSAEGTESGDSKKARSCCFIRNGGPLRDHHLGQNTG